MYDPNPAPLTPQRRQRRKGPYSVTFNCKFSKGQMEGLIKAADRDRLNVIDVIREAVNMRIGMKPPGAAFATPAVPPVNDTVRRS